MRSQITASFLLSVLLCTAMYGQQTPPTPNGTAPPATEEPNNIVKIYNLKYLKSSTALALLQDLGPAALYGEDARLNSIIVRGKATDHVAVRDLLQSLDAPKESHDITKIIEAKSTELRASEKIVKQIAEKSGVNLAVDEKLGVLLLKGPKEEVEWASDVIAKISAVQKQSDARDSKSQDAPQPCALRLIWLSNDPAGEREPQVEPEAAISASIKKLAQLGFPNMRPKMQLVGRCDLIAGQAYCQVDGSNTVGDVNRSLNFKANVKRSGDSSVVGDIKIEAHVGGVNALKVLRPQRKLSYALLGKMDLNGDMKDDSVLLKKLIESTGGNVTAGLPLDGPQYGQIDVHTSYLIIGTDVENALRDSNSSPKLDEYRQFTKQAESHGTISLSLDKLLELIKQHDSKTELAPKDTLKESSSTQSNKVEVVIHLQPQKAYILSASPIGGYQSAFLVQLVEDF